MSDYDLMKIFKMKMLIDNENGIMQKRGILKIIKQQSPSETEMKNTLKF